MSVQKFSKLIADISHHMLKLPGNLFIWCYMCYMPYIRYILPLSWKVVTNLFTHLVRVLYSKLPANSKRLPASHFRSGQDSNSDYRGVCVGGGGGGGASVLPLCHYIL